MANGEVIGELKTSSMEDIDFQYFHLDYNAYEALSEAEKQLVATKICVFLGVINEPVGSVDGFNKFTVVEEFIYFYPKKITHSDFMDSIGINSVDIQDMGRVKITYGKPVLFSFSASREPDEDMNEFRKDVLFKILAPAILVLPHFDFEKPY